QNVGRSNDFSHARTTRDHTTGDWALDRDLAAASTTPVNLERPLGSGLFRLCPPEFCLCLEELPLGTDPFTLQFLLAAEVRARHLDVCVGPGSLGAGIPEGHTPDHRERLAGFHPIPDGGGHARDLPLD